MRKCFIVVAALGIIGCRGGDGDDGPLEILPHQSPARLGQMWPATDDVPPDPGTNERVPFEWVLLLQTSSDAIEIEEVCLVGSDQFTIEGPVPEDPRRDEDAAVRVTYERTEPGGPDHAAIVVQSNAENFPTLVVPVCAQVIEDGAERSIFECESPIDVPPGEKDETACD